MNIIEFAKSMNLSIGTVSRALNDRPEVSAKTRQRVLEKAQELGFSRNANARRLVMGRNFLIRLECPYNTNILSDRYLIELARAIEEAASAHGYDLLLRLGTRNQARAASEFLAVDGLVIVSAPDMTTEDLRALTQDGQTRAVVIGEREPVEFNFPKASYVCIDTRSGVYEALALLAEMGHRRIGYVGSGYAGHQVRDVFPELMAKLGLVWDPSIAIEAGITREAGREAGRSLLTLKAPPTAIFARTDTLAIGVLEAASQLGRSVPGDVSVVGHDNIDLAAIFTPPLTTVAIDISSIAQQAMRALLAMIEADQPPARVSSGTHLIVRSSCGPVATQLD